MPFQFLGARVRGLLAVSLVALSPLVCEAQFGAFRADGTQAGRPSTHMHFASTMSSVSQFLYQGDFKKIETLYADYLRNRTRTTSGLWMVEAFQRAFSNSFQYSSEADSAKVIAAWEKAVPDSTLLPVVKALRGQRLAWNARGGAYASRTPQEAHQLFREHLEKAAQALKDSEATGKESPLWYWTALIVAGSSGVPTEAFDALFEEAVTRFPTYQTLYYTRVNYLLPQWGGTFDQVDAFVAKSVERTAAGQGASFYAWIYVDVAKKVDGDYLKETAATWPKMKQGFDDMLSRYPDPYNKLIFSAYACQARDREVTARLLTELGENASMNNILPGVTTEACRRFAFDRT